MELIDTRPEKLAELESMSKEVKAFFNADKESNKSDNSMEKKRPYMKRFTEWQLPSIILLQ